MNIKLKMFTHLKIYRSNSMECNENKVIDIDFFEKLLVRFIVYGVILSFPLAIAIQMTQGFDKIPPIFRNIFIFAFFVALLIVNYARGSQRTSTGVTHFDSAARRALRASAMMAALLIGLIISLSLITTGLLFFRR